MDTPHISLLCDSYLALLERAMKRVAIGDRFVGVDCETGSQILHQRFLAMTFDPSSRFGNSGIG